MSDVGSSPEGEVERKNLTVTSQPPPLYPTSDSSRRTSSRQQYHVHRVSRRRSSKRQSTVRRQHTSAHDLGDGYSKSFRSQERLSQLNQNESVKISNPFASRTRSVDQVNYRPTRSSSTATRISTNHSQQQFRDRNSLSRQLSVHSVLTDLDTSTKRRENIHCDVSRVVTNDQSKSSVAFASPLPRVETKFALFRDAYGCLITMNLDSNADPLSVEFLPDAESGQLLIGYNRRVKLESIDQLPNNMLGLTEDDKRVFDRSNENGLLGGAKIEDLASTEKPIYVISTVVKHRFYFDTRKYHVDSMSVSRKESEFYVKISCRYDLGGH